MTEKAPIRYRKLGRFVATRVERLQTAALLDDPATVATLARLRRCPPEDAGADPTLWNVTLAGMPAELRGQGDAPSPSERATHAALVLYALHQQGRDEGAHWPGAPLGQAVGRLARARAHEEDLDASTVQRFHQVALAHDFSQRLYFLRGLIQLLRAERPVIGLDYGLLADDLRALASQETAQRDGVLLRWGRDLHYLPTSTPKETS